MADKKISQLTAASLPLAGTEVLPIVQGSATVKVSVANLTTGRAVAMAGGSFTDNIVQGTAAKGVNFTANTPAAGMTSQLLNWYEEGIWTPTGNGITFSSAAARYVRVGKQVFVHGRVTFPSTASGSGANINSLPFTSSATTGAYDASGGVYVTYSDYGAAITALVQPSTTYFSFYNLSGGALLNSNFSTKTVYFSGLYQVT